MPTVILAKNCSYQTEICVDKSYQDSMKSLSSQEILSAGPEVFYKIPNAEQCPEHRDN
jgi:hypothetical protein